MVFTVGESYGKDALLSLGRASSEFQELREEGIVSANLHRFSTGRSP
jgi:hypothetical protein